MEYILVYADSNERLCIEVNSLLATGWICQGGVCVAGTGGDISSHLDYFQAMIKTA